MRSSATYTAKPAIHSGICGIKIHRTLLKVLTDKGFDGITVHLYSYNFSDETRQRSAEVDPPFGSGA
jgi:hypothetical protein